MVENKVEKSVRGRRPLVGRESKSKAADLARSRSLFSYLTIPPSSDLQYSH